VSRQSFEIRTILKLFARCIQIGPDRPAVSTMHHTVTALFPYIHPSPSLDIYAAVVETTRQTVYRDKVYLDKL
jgi:hypothetical protein